MSLLTLLLANSRNQIINAFTPINDFLTLQLKEDMDEDTEKAMAIRVMSVLVDTARENVHASLSLIASGLDRTNRPHWVLP